MYRLKTTAGALSTALKIVRPIIERRNTIPILGAVLLKGSTATGTDLDVEMEVAFASIEAEGEVAVPFHTIERITKLVNRDAEIEIATDDGKLALKFDGGKYLLPTFDPADFPHMAIDTPEPLAGFTDDFKAALKFAKACISTEETRYYLNGVSVDASEDAEGKVRSGIVATDGHRLACYPLDFDLSALKGAIIPRKTVDIMLKLPAPTEGARAAAGNRLEFRMPGITLRTKTIDGTYPDWRRVVPKAEAATTTIEFDRVELLHAINRVRVIANGSSINGASIGYGPGGVVIAGASPDCGTAIEYLRKASAGDRIGEVAFNARYVFDMLELFAQSKTIALRVIDSRSPAHLTGDEDPKRFAVLMPMRSGDGIAIKEATALARREERKIAA